MDVGRSCALDFLGNGPRPSKNGRVKIRMRRREKVVLSLFLPPQHTYGWKCTGQTEAWAGTGSAPDMDDILLISNIFAHLRTSTRERCPLWCGVESRQMHSRETNCRMR